MQNVSVYPIGEGFNIVTDSHLLEWSQLAILLFVFFAAFTFWKYILLGIARLIQKRDGGETAGIRKFFFSLFYNSARSEKFAIAFYTCTIGYNWIVNSSLVTRPSYVILTPGVANQVLGDPVIVLLISGAIVSIFLFFWNRFWVKAGSDGRNPQMARSNGHSTNSRPSRATV